MSKGLGGDQLVLEGLVADILNEHFGEAVELVGIALYRNGAMSFPELVRTCNLGFLGFPRDVVNRFSQFASSSEASMPFKQVRDALLILVHYGLVVVGGNGPSVYSLNVREVLNRLLLAIFLDLFQEESEKTAMEQILKRGRMRRSKLIEFSSKSVVDSLLARRAIVVIEPFVKSDDKLGDESAVIVALNTAELEFSVIKKLLVKNFESKLDAVSAQVISLLLDAVSTSGSAGTLSVSDMSKRIQAGSTSLISTLIKLQQNGYIVKKQHMATPVAAVAATTASGKKRKATTRAPNIKQMLSMAEKMSSAEEKEEDQQQDKEYFENLLGGKESGGAGPAYSVRFTDMLDMVESELCFELVRARYCREAARVFELLCQGQRLESSQIADICAISREDTLKYLHLLAVDGLCQIQEVPKIVGSSSAASAASVGGGLSAMMRAVASSFWLYSADMSKTKSFFVSLIANTLVNLRRRFRCEVSRQCKLEDRASVLTDKEQLFLERVYSAQDVLEGSAIDLVAALLVFRGFSPQ